MLHTIWTRIFYQPLYNALILGIALIPGGDVGFGIILLTVLVRLILFPLSKRSILSQLQMKSLEPEIAEIKKQFPDKMEQAKRTQALYKERKINPLSGCLLVLIQMPVIIALYLVFIHGFSGTPPVGLYSFVHLPEKFNLNFLGLIDLGGRSIVLAVLAGVSQFIQGKLAQGRQSTPTGEGMTQDFAKTMQVQMLYALPIMITFIAYKFSAAVALYWITSNIFTIAQELYTRRKMQSLKKV